MKIALIIIAAVLGSLALLGHIIQQDPEYQRMDRIQSAEKHCWRQQARKSNTPEGAAAIAAICELYEGIKK